MNDRRILNVLVGSLPKEFVLIATALGDMNILRLLRPKKFSRVFFVFPRVIPPHSSVPVGATSGIEQRDVTFPQPDAASDKLGFTNPSYHETSKTPAGLRPNYP